MVVHFWPAFSVISGQLLLRGVEQFRAGSAISQEWRRLCYLLQCYADGTAQDIRMERMRAAVSPEPVRKRRPLPDVAIGRERSRR